MRKSVVNQSEIAFVGYIQGIIAGTIPGPSENPNAGATLTSTLPDQPTAVQAFQQVYGAINPNPGQSQTPDNQTLPAITFQGGRPEQITWDCGIYEMTLTVTLETQVDDEQLPIQIQEAEDIHHARVEALRDCLEDWTQISTYINQPASEPDNRTVKSYTLSSILFKDEIEELKDRRFLTTIEYEIEACPQDAPT